ncbi:hypothetical protein, partial [Acinetobacter baumannii]|uniref:hypothetical protein n=1 Tax=Acinetobacter baumannii TaxID=470 RepID=UPI001C079252
KAARLVDKYYRRWRSNKSRRITKPTEKRIEEEKAEIIKPASLLNVTSSPEFQQVFKDLVIKEV